MWSPSEVGLERKVFSASSAIIYCTYPYYEFSKEEILENCKRCLHWHSAGCVLKAPSVVDYIVCAEEKYVSGKKHYHLLVQVTFKHVWTMKLLDSFGGVHGHYQPVRKTPERCLSYVVKDNSYVFYSRDGDELFKKKIHTARLMYGDPYGHLQFDRERSASLGEFKRPKKKQHPTTVCDDSKCDQCFIQEVLK